MELSCCETQTFRFRSSPLQKKMLNNFVHLIAILFIGKDGMGSLHEHSRSLADESIGKLLSNCPHLQQWAW